MTSSTPRQLQGNESVSCLVCGKIFKTYPCYIKAGRAKYCSKACGYSVMKKYPVGKKRCWICKNIYPANSINFSTSPSKYDGLGTECRPCGLERGKQYRGDLRRAFIESRGNKCENCGVENEDHAFFDLDHIVPLFTIGAQRKQYNFTENRQVLCPNCHRLKTLKDRGWRND